MKTLILIRHAKSDWDDQTISDFERPLNEKGLADAPMMADFVISKGIRPDILISSPAKRALMTCRIFAKKMSLSAGKIITEKEIYSGSVRDLLKIVNKIDDKNNTALLFGHNPDISYLANMLTGEFIDSMPTCSVVAIEFNVETWEMADAVNGKMIFFHYPKLLKK